MPRLLVIGSSNTDMTVRLPRLPAPGETVLGGSLLTGPGGKGANQAVAAARLGADVVFLTAVGDDAFGDAALAHYRAEGIDVAHVRRVTATASGVALILVGEQGENMIGVAPGANHRLLADDVDGLPDALFSPDTLLLVAGLEIPLATVEAAVRRARQVGMTIVLNPAPAVGEFAEMGILPMVDVVTPNRGELAALSGRPTGSLTDVNAAARVLLSLGVRHVVTTLGDQGCQVVSRAVDGTESPPQLLRADRVDAVDTVAAGDAFSAALAVELAEKRPVAQATRWAAAAAALSVTRPGAQASLARRAEVEAFVRSQG